MSEKEATVNLEIKLALPNSVAQEAEARGLLKPELLEAMLRDEIRSRKIDRLFEAADSLRSLPQPPLTEAEVEAEIQAARSWRRTSLRFAAQG